HIVVLDRRKCSEKSRVVEEAVEAAVFRHHRVGELIVVLGERFLEIEQRNDWLRAAGLLDLRMDFLELPRVAANQNHVCAVAGTRHCHRTSDTAARTGYSDDASRELGGAR